MNACQVLALIMLLGLTLFNLASLAKELRKNRKVDKLEE